MHGTLYFDYLAWIYGGPKFKWVDGMYMGIMGITAYDMLITLASSSGVTVTIQDNKKNSSSEASKIDGVATTRYVQ